MPRQLVRGAFSALVGVGFVVVFVDRERRVFARVNADFVRRVGALGRVLHDRAHRDDRAGADINGKRVERAGALGGLAATETLVGPEVVPVGTGRQVRFDGVVEFI